MADNLAKRPSKGILKNSSSFDAQAETHSNKRQSKETKWDEMNIIATLHPADKDYGHMKIDEPKTPYNYDNPSSVDVIDAADLAEKIRLGADKLPKALEEKDSDDSDSDEDLSPEEKAVRKEFENKRKAHYNEFYAVKLARKLLEEENDEEEDDNVKEEINDSLPDMAASSKSNPASCSKSCPKETK